MTEDKAEAAAQRASKPGKDINSSWKSRFIIRAKHESSFTDWCISLFTMVLAAASIYQFIILNGQLDVMRKEQRAWMYPRNNGIQVEVGKPLVVGVTWQNTGRTPAKNVSGVFRAEILAYGITPTFDLSDSNLTTRFESKMTLPGGPPMPFGLTSRALIPETQVTSAQDLTQEIVEKYYSNQVWVAAYGKVTYDDIFNVRHWISICNAEFFIRKDIMYSSPIGNEACAAYNNADE
jgi:hypothetical protein